MNEITSWFSPKLKVTKSQRRSREEVTRLRKEILDFVRTAKEINNDIVRNQFNIPSHAATRMLAELVTAKKLKLSGRSQAATYTYIGKQ